MRGARTELPQCGFHFVNIPRERDAWLCRMWPGDTFGVVQRSPARGWYYAFRKGRMIGRFTTKHAAGEALRAADDREIFGDKNWADVARARAA